MDHYQDVPLSYPNPSLGQMGSQSNTSDDAQPIHRSQSTPQDSSPRATGLHQATLVASLLIGLLFATLDTSIVSTSLVTIAHELNDFVNAPWIVLAYLLTYMGFAIIISKLSDIYGRRNMLLLSWITFMGFSLGCGSSKDMTSLIVCRAFQGIGGSGLYSLTQIGLVEVGPIHRPSLIGALIGATLAIAFVLGPIVGGVISQLSDWRWIFNINIPFGLVTILAITNLWPQEENTSNMFSWKAFKKIDFLGGITLLLSSGLLVFALQQAGSRTYSWDSAAIIVALVLSTCCWGFFIAWELLLQKKRNHKIEPIFPMELMTSRVYALAVLITLLTGFPYIALVIVIPERFQIVYGESVIMAGVHILPLLGACAAGSFLGGALSSKRNNTSYTIIAASSFQLLGAGLMMLPSSAHGPAQYGFQVLFGLGVGLSFSGATIMTSILATKPNQRAAAQGAIAQARVLGGCVGLAICTIIFNIHVDDKLWNKLTPSQLADLERSPLSGLSLPSQLRDLVKEAYKEAFHAEIKIMVFVCAAMVAASLLTWEANPPPLDRLTGSGENETKERPSSRRGSGSVTELNEVRSVHRQV